MKYKCLTCDYIYDEEKEGLNFKGLSPEWICPECGAPKSEFELLQEENEEVNSEAEDDGNFLGDEGGIEGGDIDDDDEFKEEDY